MKKFIKILMLLILLVGLGLLALYFYDPDQGAKYPPMFCKYNKDKYEKSMILVFDDNGKFITANNINLEVNYGKISEEELTKIRDSDLNKYSGFYINASGEGIMRLQYFEEFKWLDNFISDEKPETMETVLKAAKERGYTCSNNKNLFTKLRKLVFGEKNK